MASFRFKFSKTDSPSSHKVTYPHVFGTFIVNGKSDELEAETGEKPSPDP